MKSGTRSVAIASQFCQGEGKLDEAEFYPPVDNSISNP